MASLEKHLIRESGQLALLFTPPFDKTPHNPGYIKGYPPGLRENGGQYSHAAMWAVLAFAQLGEGDKAFKLFSMLNPINHARTPEDAARYKVEPYVVAADVYSVAPHVGRGGWTWYTGAAGWMYRAGVEGILGIRREGEWLVIDPCIPTDWPGFEAGISTAKTHYDIRVKNASKQSRGITAALLDDKPLACTDGVLRVPLDGGRHVLDVMA
jgi:cyclic beta-1,2-glucan synthetase